MSLSLKKILNTLILESVSETYIIDAINNGNFVRITYKEDNDNTTKRIINPHALGNDKRSGNRVVRAYQSFGTTKTGNAKWKYFRVDKIIKWETLPTKINNPISDYDSSIPKYRKGDRTMGTVSKQK